MATKVSTFSFYYSLLTQFGKVTTNGFLIYPHLL